MKNFGGVLTAVSGGLASVCLYLLLRRRDTPTVPPPAPNICHNDVGRRVGLSILVSGDGDLEVEGEDIHEGFTEADDCDVGLVAVEGELCTGDGEVDAHERHERGGGECTRNDDIAEREGQNCLADVDESHLMIDHLVVESRESTTYINQQINDTPYRVAPNHTEASHEASLVEVVNQTIFYIDPVTKKKNNGFSLLQCATLDKAEQGVSVLMNQPVNGTPCGPTPKPDREPLDKEPEEEILMDVSDRGTRFPPPDQIHGLKHPRASRHAIQRGSGIPRMVASEGEGHHRRGSQQRTCAPGQRRMKQMWVAKSRGGTALQHL